MRRPFGLYYIIAFLSIIGIALLTIFRHKLSFVSLPDQTIITKVKDLVTIIALILGGIAAYFRFFSGRTFSLKAEVDLSCEVIKMPSNDCLHLVKISFKNVGSFVIKYPTATVLFTAYHKDSSKNFTDKIVNISEYCINNTWADKFPSSALQGETIFYEFEKEFSAEVWAVKYVVEVQSKSTNWTNFKIISNSIELKKG